MNELQLERFMKKVEVTEGCWFWHGAKNNNGYGMMYVGYSDPETSNGARVAHRLSFEHWVHPIGAGLEIDHLCRVRHCVNPSHLRAVTHKQNMACGLYAMKTHCKHGHDIRENFYKQNKVSGRGGRGYSRRCKICHSKAMKKWNEKRKAKNSTPI